METYLDSSDYQIKVPKSGQSLVAGEPTLFENWDLMASQMVNVLGMPVDPYGSVPPGFETTMNSVPPTPPLAVVKEFWDGSIQAVEGVVQDIYNGAKGVGSSIYADLKQGVGAVVEDVTEPAASALKTTFWYAVVGLVVIGGVLYFAGKSGALSVRV